MPRAPIPERSNLCQFHFANSRSGRLAFVEEPEADEIVAAVPGGYLHFLWPSQAAQAENLRAIADTIFRQGENSKAQEIIACLGIDRLIEDAVP